MKIAFVIGHTKLFKGAYSSYFNKYEYDFWKGFECELKEFGDVFYHNYLVNGYNKRQIITARKTKEYDVVFELHFNSSNSVINGCEALYYHDNKETKDIANRFCDKYTNLTGCRNRGAKELYKKTQRGFGFLKNQKPNSIILEPFFGDNYWDCHRFEISKFTYAVKYSIKQ